MGGRVDVGSHKPRKGGPRAWQVKIQNIACPANSAQAGPERGRMRPFQIHGIGSSGAEKQEI
jgi:hypothetical protein